MGIGEIKSMNDANVINQVISLFLIIGVGVVASKRKIITENINKGLTAILLKITLPLYIVYSFNFPFSKEMATNVSKAFIYGLVIFLLTIILSYIFLFFIKGEKKKILQFGNVFSNCGFMGFAVMGSIYGNEGIVYTSVFNMYFTIFVWTYGVMLFSDKISLKEMKKLVFNPGLVAVYVGIFLMVFHIQLHPILQNSFYLVGSMTTPISMLIIGFLLSRINLKSIFNNATIFYGTLLKLIVIPLSLYGFSLIIGDHSKVILTLILLQAMPAGAMTSIFAENFDKEQEYATILVFITTLLSIATFPLILGILNI